MLNLPRLQAMLQDIHQSIPPIEIMTGTTILDITIIIVGNVAVRSNAPLLAIL